MSSRTEQMKADLERLMAKAELLHYTLLRDLERLDAGVLQKLKKNNITLYKDFKKEYESWYSEAYYLIKAILPDRLADFISYYKIDKRKTISYENYTMSDFIINLRIEGNLLQGAIVDTLAAIPKFKAQKNILASCERKFESTLFDIKDIVQADLFDNELDAAMELNKNRYARAAGAVSGVVPERHLSGVCKKNGIKFTKKNLTINDFNEALKAKEIIDTSTWRNIQYLADIRNLCDHAKHTEPTMEKISDLIDGVTKIIKTV